MNCIICSKSDSNEIYPGLTRCNNCGLIFFNNKLSEDEVKDLYKEEYFKGSEYLNYQEDKKIIQKNFGARLKNIKKIIPNGDLFEIGSAYGFFLELAKVFYKVEGIDITEQPTNFARESLHLNVHTGNYLSHINDSKRDIFCMWDTIEHLPNPDKFIEKISKEIKTGGYLFITTGDIGSMLAKIQKRKWRMIHPPTHLFYFSKKSITKLLKNNGFKVESISHPGIYRSSKEIVHGLLFLNKQPKGIDYKIRKAILKFFEYFDFPVYLNTFDIMMVIAKKI
jgi:2-polyprenyl-3-methyl-5-hydroxy-6-metoxy-1,4-benzoquinol methylase